ncbi:MAG TPA: ABC transporter ATP-binding protein [Candidatus Saccharimonadales bacterium]
MHKSTGRQSLKLYWQFAKPHRKYMVGNLLLFPITVLLHVQLLSYVVSAIVDELAAGNLTQFGDYLPYITWLAFIELANFIIMRFNIFFLWRHEDYVMKDISEASFSDLSHRSAQFHADRFSGALVTQVSKFVHGYERLYDAVMFNLYTLAWSVVLSSILLWLREPILAIVLIGFALLYAWLVIVKYKEQIPFNIRWAQAESARTAQLADSITNILAVKATGQEDYEQKLFSAKAEKVKQRGQETMWNVQKKEFLLSPINAGAGIMAIIIAIISVIWWGQPVGTVVLALYLSRDILRRVWDLNNVMRQFNRVLGDAHDMTEIFMSESEVKDQKDSSKLEVSKAAVIFENVTFKYADSKGEHLFKNLNLEVGGGERIGLVGPSGGGKTTITKLLLRFMDVESGQVTIDGQDISRVSQQDLRRNIAYVPQEPLLFHRSLAENIRYGRPAASQTEVVEAAKLAHAHDFIERLPDKYQTKVGERGVKLSGGQRQRVAIARAILKDSPIIILDEATSSLDSSSEKLIQEALWELMKGRTALVIAHRLSTVQRMDRIVVLDEGRIIEQGNHAELLKKKGIYSELWNHQTGGFIK